jgi:hypothetical protein
MKWEMIMNSEYESLCGVDVVGDLNVHSPEKMHIKHAILWKINAISITFILKLRTLC